MAFTADFSSVTRVVPSPNHDARTTARPDMVVLHYTGMADANAALERLCARDSKVSCHYLVREDGAVFQLVPESRRAWHAGVSCWEGTTDINSRSIGIEIVNPGHDFGYPNFPAGQIGTVIDLCRTIVQRYRIRADRVLGHSDVAPLRKNDPGEKFPWRLLAASGVGVWLEPAPLTEGPALEFGDRGPTVSAMQTALSAYGYGVGATGFFDQETQAVVVAFQRHFRPARIDGVADPSTLDTLERLCAVRRRLAEQESENGKTVT